MSYCPICGSDHITLKRETNVSWGRAVVGWALLGPVAGAVGAVTGEDRTVNACLNCGESWKAKELYGAIQHLNKLVSVEIDLSLERDRRCLKDYVGSVPTSYITLDKAKADAAKRLGAVQQKNDEELSGWGVFAGGLSGFALLCLTKGEHLWLAAFVVVGSYGIASSIVPKNQKINSKNEETLAKAKERYELEISAAQNECTKAIERFQRRWSHIELV
jgi:hypothetical protein